MAEIRTDIVIIGVGIAGLWTYRHLKSLGYDVLLLEREAIGAGQTLASQGIIHSGLKYAFAGQINELARSISAMPDLWRAALKGQGPVDLSAARMNAESQILLVPSGLMGGLVKLVTKKVLGGRVREIPKTEWPADIKASGFKGSLIYMDEPVLDVSSVIKALAGDIRLSADPLATLKDHGITAQKIIVTAAGSNADIAAKQGHDNGLATQKRPLLMGMLKPAPFELYAHLVGTSDKPVATITTHKREDGTLVWYLGGGVAERAKESNPQEVIDAARAGFKKYLPGIDLSAVEWGTLPIDRVEGKSDKDGWMPDTPTIHSAGDMLYCWPTKLTFSPLLSKRIAEILAEENIKPSGVTNDWSFLPEAPFAKGPWETDQWS
ncbi:MAG: FAD-dependent oxidoreductase [Alphaproteobacteria bacterium]|nr:FAD-dependent oxidoreductase [Alphaproteobacteria bacterium]